VHAGSAQAGRSGWAFEALYHAVDEVRAATQAKAETFTLFGFSAGAQFALRLQFLLGAPQIDRLIASSAGWYTLPSAEYDWPCGLGGMPVAEQRLAATVARKLTVVVGLDDTKVRDDFGDRGYEACSARQGRNRLERAEAFMQAGLRQAQRLSVANGWRLVKVAGAGHSVEDLLRVSSDEILAQTWR
jgi:pimeloyl-ACP methyl ester carboxylesterase